MPAQLTKQERLPAVVNPTVLPHLLPRQATAAELKAMTPEQKEINKCCHCGTIYRPGSGAAWICEHWHEGL